VAHLSTELNGPAVDILSWGSLLHLMQWLAQSPVWGCFRRGRSDAPVKGRAGNGDWDRGQTISPRSLLLWAHSGSRQRLALPPPYAMMKIN